MDFKKYFQNSRFFKKFKRKFFIDSNSTFKLIGESLMFIYIRKIIFSNFFK